MEYRKLGKTNELISVLGYGASPLGNVFDVVVEQEGKNAVHYAIDHGVNFLMFLLFMESLWRKLA